VSRDPRQLAAIYDDLLGEHIALFERSRGLIEPTVKLAEAGIAALRAGNKLFLAGNGGSAADAQHIATELVVRFETSRRGLPAIALTTDTSALTAASNDLGFDHVFARQIEALGRAGDLFIAFTTSGTSANVVEALRTARRLGLETACLTGRDGGTVAKQQLAAHCLVVPGDNTARIQECHIFLGHLLCAAIDRAFTE
jgi:D-sedoheptulose 7-phosphate isomerase